MLVLFETAAGVALFRVLDEGKIKKVDNIENLFESPEKAAKVVQLHAFKKFKDTKEALKTVSKLVDGALSKKLTTFLKKNVVSQEVQHQLACADKKLASTISETLGIKCKGGDKARELLRGIRFQMNSLLGGLSDREMRSMNLGLAHSVSRYTLKFSAEKVDVMIIQAAALLDDLDKELNNYAMRLKEWYSWHFPELAQIVSDNSVFAKVCRVLGRRKNIGTA